MTLNEALKQLKALGNETTRAHNTKYGAGDNQFGVKLGDILITLNKAADVQPFLIRRPAPKADTLGRKLFL